MSVISVLFPVAYRDSTKYVFFTYLSCLPLILIYIPFQKEKKKTFQIDKYFSEHVSQAIRMAHESFRENKIMILKAVGRSLSVEKV